MSNAVKILQYIILIVLLGAVCFLYIGKCSSDKKNTKLSAELMECRSAKPKIDTVIITDTIREIQYIKPKPKPNLNDNGGVSQPTTAKCNDITTTYYSDVFEKKGAKIHWEALAECSNDSAVLRFIRFPEIVIPKEIVTITGHDTIPKEVPAKLRGKFAIYGGVLANNFKEFPGVELGVGYVHKQSWGILGGPVYIDKTMYGSIKVFVTF